MIIKRIEVYELLIREIWVRFDLYELFLNKAGEIRIIIALNRLSDFDNNSDKYLIIRAIRDVVASR